MEDWRNHTDSEKHKYSNEKPFSLSTTNLTWIEPTPPRDSGRTALQTQPPQLQKHVS